MVTTIYNPNNSNKYKSNVLALTLILPHHIDKFTTSSIKQALKVSLFTFLVYKKDALI